MNAFIFWPLSHKVTPRRGAPKVELVQLSGLLVSEGTSKTEQKRREGGPNFGPPSLLFLHGALWFFVGFRLSNRSGSDSCAFP